MSPTADRERRLWVATIVTVAALFASIPYVPTLVGALQDRGLLEPAFGLGFAATVTIVVTSGLGRGGGPRVRWVATGVAVAYGMVLVRLGLGPAERTHLFEYGLVALLVHAALLERRRHGRRAPNPALTAFVTASAIGVLDEAAQWFIPGRVFDLRDVAFNVGAAAAAISASVAIGAARRRDA